MTSRTQQCLEEFLKIYKSEPCLWQIKNKDYHDRKKKDAAYDKLVAKLRDIEPQANKETVVRKINSIRSTYRKECKKIRASWKSGSEDVYEPKLWYFKILSFLNDVYTPRGSYSNLENDSDGNENMAHFEESQFEQNREDNWKKLKPTAVPTLFNVSNSRELDAQIASDESVHEDITGDTSEWPEPVSFASASTSQHNYSRSPKRSLQPSSELTNEVAIKCQTDQDDRFDIFGKSIAIKLRELPKQQRLLAEKIINETLFEAEMNNLTMLHRLTCQPKVEPY